MIHPLDYLLEIGLGKSEAKLYLAGLTLGRSGVAQLVAETKIKRPTVYHALNQLADKGLATVTKEGKELRYAMKPPEDLKEYIDSRVSSFARSAARLSEVATLFPQSRKQPAQTPPIRQFRGQEEIERALDLALYCTSRRWDIVAPIDNFIARADKAYRDYFKETRRAQGIVSRSLWESKKVDRDINLRDLINRKPRYLPKQYVGTFSGMMILFDNKALLIGLEEAVLIQNPDTFNLLALMFDSLWGVAEKP